jgi:hypothetical protein
MDTQDCGIRVGVWRETVEVESVWSVLDLSIECFELVTLEGSCLIFLIKLDDNAMFLYVCDPKSLMGEGSYERCVPR